MVSRNHIGIFALCVSWIFCLLAQEILIGLICCTSIWFVLRNFVSSGLVIIEFVLPVSNKASILVVCIQPSPMLMARNGSLDPGFPGLMLQLTDGLMMAILLFMFLISLGGFFVWKSFVAVNLLNTRFLSSHCGDLFDALSGDDVVE